MAEFSPEDEAAAFFMERKGYPLARPRSKVKVDGQDCWYYVYRVGAETIEIEVEWTGIDWSSRVSAFTSA